MTHRQTYFVISRVPWLKILGTDKSYYPWHLWHWCCHDIKAVLNRHRFSNGLCLSVCFFWKEHNLKNVRSCLNMLENTKNCIKFLQFRYNGKLRGKKLWHTSSNPRNFTIPTRILVNILPPPLLTYTYLCSKVCFCW